MNMSQAQRTHSDQPPFSYAEYRSTLRRAPSLSPIAIAQSLSEVTGPGPRWSQCAVESADLTLNAGTGLAALGERTIVTGRVLDEHGDPVSNTLVEVWQADASGRYAHVRDTEFDAPRDPNFIGAGQCLTDRDGNYRFTTIKPGAYPWGNHDNAWRPAHIHFSLLGPALVTRLVTQMYFPNDPLLPLDPIFRAVPEQSRQRLISRYDHSVTQPRYALGYRFDIVLRGHLATPSEVSR